MIVEANADHEDGYEQETRPCDLHCPALPQPGLNFWKSSCAIKQKDPRIKTCYGGCKAGTKELTGIKKKYRYTQYNLNIKRAIELFNKGYNNVQVAAELKLSYSSAYKYRRMAKQNGLLTAGE